jgi:hypothetical protein
MVTRSIFSLPFLYCLAAFCCLWPLSSGAQLAEKKPAPDQLDIFKVSLTQLAINELRLSYEIQLQPKTSLELGGAYIFRNPTWFDQGGTLMLADGWAAYAGIRQYFDRKTYIFQPKFRSYIGLQGFARFSDFENEWLGFGSGTDLNNVFCELISAKFQQYGLVTRIGSQTRAGRIVLDFYGGLGIKHTVQQLTSHAVNDSTDICGPIAATKYREETASVRDWGVVFTGGIQLGIRHNNRERKSRDMVKPADPDYQESPPQF